MEFQILSEKLLSHLTIFIIIVDHLMYLVSNAWCTLSVPTCTTFVAPPYSFVWEMWYITRTRKVRSAIVSQLDPQPSTSIVVYSPCELNFVSTQSRRLLQHILIHGLVSTMCLWTPCTRRSTSCGPELLPSYFSWKRKTKFR